MSKTKDDSKSCTQQLQDDVVSIDNRLFELETVIKQLQDDILSIDSRLYVNEVSFKRLSDTSIRIWDLVARKSSPSLELDKLNACINNYIDNLRDTPNHE